MSRLAIKRFLIIALSAIMIFLTLMLAQEPISLVFTSCVVFFFVLGVFYRFDYLHPATAYLLPWLMILIFSILPISSYARRIDFATYELLLAGMFAWLLSCVGAPVGSGHDSLKNNDSPDNVFPRNAPATASFALTASIVFLFAFAALNVAFAGFVPILSLLSTGDSRYMEFGVPSVYGAYLAYANALGCVVFYLYLRTHRRKYLLVFISILIMHVIFITRQNMITLLVEAFAIRCLAVKRVSKITMVGFLAIALIVFSIIGGLRSGNIQ